MEEFFSNFPKFKKISKFILNLPEFVIYPSAIRSDADIPNKTASSKLEIGKNNSLNIKTNRLFDRLQKTTFLDYF